MSGIGIAYFVGIVMVFVGAGKWFGCKFFQKSAPDPFGEDPEDLYAAYFWLKYGTSVLVGAFVFQFLYGLITKPGVPQVENAMLYLAIAAIEFSAIDMVRAQYNSPEKQTTVSRAYVRGLRLIQMLFLAICALGFIMSLLGLDLLWSSCASFLIVAALHFILRISK